MTKQHQPRKSLYIVILILLTFFVISFLTNIINPLIPKIKEDFNLSLTLVALLPFAFFIAYGVMSIPAGILNEKYKEKKMMIVAFLLSFGASLLLALFPNYLTAVISLFLIGCGMAMLQVIINPLLRIAGGEEHYAFNSVLAQLIFGAASFLSPLVYSYFALNLNNPNKKDLLLDAFASLVPYDLPWISLYWIFSIISVAMVILVLFSKFPKVKLDEDQRSDAFSVFVDLLRKPKVWLFFLAIFCYEGTEQGIGNWVSQYLYEYHQFDPQTVGARVVSNFWGLMTLGGLLGLVLLKIMDSKKVLIIFTAFAILSLTAGLFSSAEVALWAFPAVGFFASVMYPIIFSLSLNSLEKHQGAFAGILLTGITGAALFPLIIGWLGDYFGLRTGMFILYITLAYVLSVGFWANPLINNKTLRYSRKEKRS